MDKIEAKEFDNYRDRQLKVNDPEVMWAYGGHLALQRYHVSTQSTLMKYALESSTESLKCYDYNSIEPTEIQQILEGAHLNWVKYLQAYEEYSRLINDSSELERLSIQWRTLEQNLNDCNQLATDQLDKSIRSLQRGSIPVDNHHFNDDERISLSAHSSISMSGSSKSRRSVGSSVSSKSRAAARSAELAKLKLEQAERRAKTKQKQMQEQIEQELQDLRDQAEYSQLEAHLLAADQAGDRFSDRSSKRSWPKTTKGTNTKLMRHQM